MSLKDGIEGFLDSTIGKPARKVVEQIGHALMAGAPAFLIVNWLPLPLGWSIGLALLLSLIFGTVREVIQNWGDEPDEETLFMISRLPVNLNMLADMGGYSVGGVLAGVMGFVV